MKKYDRELNEYLEFQKPSDWNTTYFETNLDAEINCPHCGKTLPYKDSYTSMEIYSDNGFWGYAVCEDCYKGEVKRRFGRKPEDR